MKKLGFLWNLVQAIYLRQMQDLPHTFFFLLKEKKKKEKKRTQSHPTIILRSSVIQIKLPPQHGCESKNKKSM